MRTVKWIAAAALAAVMLYTCALPGDLPAEVDTTDGLAGTYTVNGVDPTEREFSGTAVFRATDDPDRFDFDLIITGSVQQGRAVRSGDRLAVTWEALAAAGDDPLTGTGDYRIQPDGRITGTWRVDGADIDASGAEIPGTIELFPDP